MNCSFDMRNGMFEIWLTQEEKDNAEINASLRPVIETCRKSKIRPVIYYSGTEDLKEETANLLQLRCRRMLAAKSEQSAG